MNIILKLPERMKGYPPFFPPVINRDTIHAVKVQIYNFHAFSSPNHLVPRNQTSRSATLRRNFPGCQGVWNQTVVPQVLEIPLGCALRLPVPENPSGVCLVSIQLCLDIVLQVCLVGLRHGSDSAGVLSSAVSNIAASWKCPVIPSSCSKTIQPFRAISLSP
jgi:hypothetical protein